VARLLRAVERLDDRETNAVVRIAGSGELSDTIERKADSLSNLEYDGFVSSDDLPEIYSRARALLVPKQAGDAFPTLTILEALASGTAPVLVKDTVSAPGFTAGETYVRARPTAASLADAIAKLAADRRLVDRLGARSRQCALDHYEWESRIDDLEALYRTVGSGTVS
jgi:glycosyltransferase involved in cell wall biosynthesis